ncbi:MAG: hypothetical protein B6229_02915 [Spirochaetaceae bacterium 4572_7]|nr:MAG: hypothetical protein B6229_02915 [Spirochaetaceae bacterium 4572_7]
MWYDINMKKILILDTGGTISQERGSEGALVPGIADIIEIVPRLSEIADISYKLITRVDSTNMTQDIRVAITKEIESRHMDFDGFVITHGTDTMVDTACALNYMIQDLGKPIVLTGAQLPMFAPGPDGLNNLYYSVKTATDDIGEVVICFGDRILRGNRSIKENVHGFNAFNSPRTPFIGNLGIDVKLNENRIKRFNGIPKFFTNYNSGIAVYTQVSGGTTDILKYYANEPSVTGVIIQGFGTGNTQHRLIKDIKKIIDCGKPIVIITICLEGNTILGQYQTGLLAEKSGALPGKDLSIHAATQKMIYALGRNPKDFNKYFYQEIGRDMI